MRKKVQSQAELGEVKEPPDQLVSPRALEARVKEPGVADFRNVLQHLLGTVAVRKAAERPCNDRPPKGIATVTRDAAAAIAAVELGEEVVARDSAELGGVEIGEGEG